MDQREHRRHRRFEVQNVDGTFLYNVGINVLNISLAGMAVQTDHSLRVGRPYAFRIRNETDVLNVRGTVAWCVLRKIRSDSNGDTVPVYHAGIRFDDVLTERAEELRHLIEEHVVLDVGKRVFGRFRLNPNTNFRIESQVIFEVRKISLSGMLTHTSLTAERENIFPLEISLPNGLFSANGRIAYVETVDESMDDKTYHLGVEFLDASDESRNRLEEFITFYVESEPESEAG